MQSIKTNQRLSTVCISCITCSTCIHTRQYFFNRQLLRKLLNINFRLFWVKCKSSREKQSCKSKQEIMADTLISEVSCQQIHHSNNLNLTCISEAGGKWWGEFVSTGQIMSSQPDVDRWRQRLALPPVLHKHAFGNSFFTGQLPDDLWQPTHMNTHILDQLLSHWRYDNSHRWASHKTCVHRQACRRIKYGWQLSFWRAQLPGAAFKHKRQSDSDTPNIFGVTL